MKWCSVRNVIIVDKEKLCLNTQKKNIHTGAGTGIILSVNWIPEITERLYKALMNSSTVTHCMGRCKTGRTYESTG